MELNALEESTNKSVISSLFFFFASTPMIRKIVRICDVRIDFYENRLILPKNFLNFRIDAVE